MTNDLDPHTTRDLLGALHHAATSLEVDPVDEIVDAATATVALLIDGRRDAEAIAREVNDDRLVAALGFSAYTRHLRRDRYLVGLERDHLLDE